MYLKSCVILMLSSAVSWCRASGKSCPCAAGVIPLPNSYWLELQQLKFLFVLQLKPAGISCRESSNSCDLPEFCTGASPHCPANVYLHDGHACHRVDGYCYNGICQTHEQQCVTLWGQGESENQGCCLSGRLEKNPTRLQMGLEEFYAAPICIYSFPKWRTE